MKPSRRLALLVLGAFLVGGALGLYVQHRWPLGRWREHTAPPPPRTATTLADLAAIPRERRLVILVAGQSNAANYGETRASGGPGVFVYHGGAIYAARDPLPGADRPGGSIWTRLGARLMLTGNYDAILFAVEAVGSTRVDDWAPGGLHHGRLESTLRGLSAAGLPPDFFLWQQGETEGWSDDAAGSSYRDSLRRLIARIHAASPTAVAVIAQATFGAHTASNAQIRAAQASVADGDRVRAGPDLDRLGADYRRDGIHFSARGLDAAADLWLDALRPALIHPSAR